MQTNDSNLIPSEALIDEAHIGKGDFCGIGEGFVSRFFDRGWLCPDDVFVDIGCGLGRIARSLVSRLSGKGQYLGFDVNKKSIEWCQEKYRHYNNFHFVWIDLFSVFYNPGSRREGTVRSRKGVQLEEGKAMPVHIHNASAFQFPLPRDSVDFVNLTSVFTHMLPRDVERYLTEIGRMLKPGKLCHITYFLVDPGSREAIVDASKQGRWHPIEHGYVRNQSVPEEMVLLDEKLVRDLYAKTGLLIEEMTYGNWFDRAGPTFGFQDIILASKSAQD